MTTLFSIILLLIAVVAANIFYLVWPKIPLSLYQLVAGLVLSLDPQYSHFTFEPEIFMIAIIAPLMFNDGQNQAFKSITKHFNTTLSLAVTLSIITVGLVGILAHTIWPFLALPVAFMLGAIVTPTDSVAVSSITKDIVLPDDVNGALEHESLFNDASGIVLFNLALSAFMSGNFSLTSGILSFVKVFFGGIIFGLIVGMLIVKLRMTLTQSHADISAIVVPINVMTPVAVYWFAERFGFSGILAVVATGLVHSILHDRLRLTSTKLQIVTSTTWTILSDILNGFVFVLLGATLPTVLSDINVPEIGTSFLIALFLYVLLFVLRYLWIRLNLAPLHRHHKNTPQQAWQIAISGIHGTMTLAMAFSIPTVVNGVPFALRKQLIFIAALVILISLLVPTILLPLLLPKKQRSYTPEQFDTHISDMVYYAINTLRQNNQDSRELQLVVNTLTSQAGSSHQINRKAYIELAEKAQEIEQDYITALNEQGNVSDDALKLYDRFLQRSSAQHSWRNFFKIFIHRFKLKFNKKAYQRNMAMRQKIEQTPALKQKWQDRQQATLQILNGAKDEVIQYLDTIETQDNMAEVNLLRQGYQQRTKHFEQRETYSSEVTNALFIQAFQSEYTYVQQQVAAGSIVQELANQLNEQVSVDQMAYMQEMMD